MPSRETFDSISPYLNFSLIAYYRSIEVIWLKEKISMFIW